jgi:hypothetical protein
LGLGSGNFRPVLFNNSFHNSECAVRNRVTVDVNLPITPALDRRYGIAAFRRWLLDGRRLPNSNYRMLLGSESFTKVEPVSIFEYLRRSNAMPSVKKKILQAHFDLQSKGVDQYHPLTKDQVKRFCLVKCFVKIENLLYRTAIGSSEKASRAIMGSTPEFLCLVGPWMMALSDLWKKRFDFGGPFVMATGKTTKQISDYIEEIPDARYNMNDVSHWDTSVKRNVRRLEYDLYKLHSPPAAVRQLLQFDSNRTRGIFSTGIYFSLGSRAMPDTQRPSGRPDTTLGNSAMNGFIHVWGFCRTWGVDVATCMEMVRIVVMGDDNVNSSVKSRPTVPFVDVFRAVGFEAEFQEVNLPCQLEFCSMYNYPVVGGHCFGPKVGRVTAKLGYFVDPPVNLDPRVLVRGTALGLWPAASYIPPLRMYLQQLLDLTQDVEARPTHREEWQLLFSVCESNFQTDDFLHRKYGWSGVLENAFGAEIAKPLGSELVGPVFEHLCWVDTDGPKSFLKIW